MSRFFRVTTDRQTIPAEWDGACAGPVPSACWLIGGGPSLAALPCGDIAASPVPKMAVNLAGTKLIRPNFWTAYDPSVRFHRSIYLDAGIAKFLPRSRSFDLVPETNFKVCESPQTYFFDRDPQRGYRNFLDPQAAGIVDWADTLVQAIDILYRLGFRRLFLAGCELCLRPGRDWIAEAARHGVSYLDGELLSEFVQRCNEAGLSATECQRLGIGPQYHFDEAKAFESAVRTDAHYFRIVQALRLCRQALSSAGVQLISVTPRSRLNPFFEYRPAEEVLDRIRQEIGDPAREETRGQYARHGARQEDSPPAMRDQMPPRRSSHSPAAPCAKLTGLGNTDLIVEEEAWVPADEVWERAETGARNPTSRSSFRSGAARI